MCKTARVTASHSVRNSAGDDLRGVDFPMYTPRDSDMASEAYARRRDAKKKKKGRDFNGEEIND